MDIEKEKLRAGKRSLVEVADLNIHPIGKKKKLNNTEGIKNKFIYFYRRKHTSFVRQVDLAKPSLFKFLPAGIHTKITFSSSQSLCIPSPLHEEEGLDLCKAWLTVECSKDASKAYCPHPNRVANVSAKSIEKQKQKKLIEELSRPSAAVYNKQKLCRLYNISYSKLKYILHKNKAATGGLAPSQKRQCYVQEKHLTYLKTFLSNPKNNISTLLSLKQELLSKFPNELEQISLSTISRMIKRINFSRKRCAKYLYRRNTDLMLELRKDVTLTYLNYVKQGKRIISIDETGVNGQLIPAYVYSKKGKRVCLPVMPKGVNHTVIAAVDKEGLIGFSVLAGGASATDFGAFMCDLVCSSPDIKENLHNVIFFMDNCAIHKARILREFNQHLNILFNAPYSPFANFIEEVFAVWKYKIRVLNFHDNSDVLSNIVLAASQLTKRHFSSSFAHSFTYFQDCILKHPIE